MIGRDIDLTEKLDFNKDKKLLPMVSSGSDLLSDKESKKKMKEELGKWNNTCYYTNNNSSTTYSTINYSSDIYATTSYNFNGGMYNYSTNVTFYDNSTYYHNNFGTYDYGTNLLTTTQSNITNHNYTNIRVDNSGTIISYYFNTKVPPKTEDEKTKEIFSRSKDYNVLSNSVNLRDHDRSMKSTKTFAKKFKDRLNEKYLELRRGSRYGTFIPWDYKISEEEKKYDRKIPWLRRLSTWNYKDYMDELKGNDVDYMHYLDSNWYNPRHGRRNSSLNAV